jgi:SOS-response transcriptional repressor LexA
MPARSKSFSQRLQSAIEAALAERGLSGRQASIAVVGHDGLIRDIRAGSIPSADRLEALCELLGLEFYIGPPRGPAQEPQAAEVRVEGEAFSALPLYGAELAAGAGRANAEEEVVERLAFRREWLSRIGVSPAQAVLVKVRGDSMQPTLADGDLVLIDRARTEGSKGRVYALVDVSGDTRVKRLDRPDRATLVLRSDNPAHPLELRRGPDLDRLRIIGEVRWSGHTWR